MKVLKGLTLHIVLLLAAAAFAYVQSRPEDPASRPLEPGEVELWTGSPDDVTLVTFTGKRKVVSLSQRKDDRGIWYFGEVGPVASPEPEPEDADAGKKNPHAPAALEDATFVSVEVAERLMKELAPLRAKRAVGEVADDRAEAFGLDDPEGTLVVEVGGKRHELVIGKATPGTGLRYVRNKGDNLVYVIDAAVVRDIEGGAGRLSERQQHGFKIADVQRATIAAQGETRSLMRGGTEGHRFWADTSAPDVNAETAANWLGKVDRLRPIKYLAEMPAGAERIVRVDYDGEDEKLGFLELHRAEVDGKPEFLLVTEQIRLPATVAKTVGEQVRDDLGTVLGIEVPDAGDGGEGGDEGEEDDVLDDPHDHGGEDHGGEEAPDAPPGGDAKDAPPKGAPPKGAPPKAAPPKGAPPKGPVPKAPEAPPKG